MKTYTNRTEKYKAVIEEDPSVGFYLYIYDINNEKCLFDSLQDSLEIAKNQAQRDFSIDINTWIKAS